MGFLRRVHGVTLRNKVHSCEIRRGLDVRPLSREPSYVGSAMCPEYPMKNWRGKFFWRDPRESGPDVVQGTGGVTTSPTLLGPVLVWSQQSYLKLLLTVRYFGSSWGCCPRDPPYRKRGRDDEWMHNLFAIAGCITLNFYELRPPVSLSCFLYCLCFASTHWA